jgi:hypothetical protein
MQKVVKLEKLKSVKVWAWNAVGYTVGTNLPQDLATGLS